MTSHWVQCDRCSQWRRVPADYAATIDDDVSWYCENNPEPTFADCKIPQELTDAEIDQETAAAAAAAAVSEGDDEEEEQEEDEEEEEDDDEEGDGDDGNGAAAAAAQPSGAAKQPQRAGGMPKLPAIIQLISENFYSHRKRKQQDEDDIMVCHCPPPWRGGDGCGPNCINRMLCIECTEDFCPCESHCNNQMFTRKQYGKVSVRRAGPKGFGLYADEDLAAGQFVIQYVGEVLEEEEYLRRKQYYISTGQRHYYFMNIGNGEVIDACRKGNVARFINHSCEPNCETQKWMVQGELAIGLFTLRKIKAGEELTFDYNFERYGDKPMRCYCGSKRCRKFIGGTQETTANIVELGDAEDVTHDPEPVLVQESETDGLVQAMLDKEVGTTQRRWDAKLLNRLQQLCRSKGIDWAYAPDEAGRTASTQASPGRLDQSEESSHAANGPAAVAASPASSAAPGGAGRLGLDGAESPLVGGARPRKQPAARRKRKAETDPVAAAAAAAKKQAQEERKRQKLLQQEQKRQRQQELFLKRQEEELARIQRLRDQQQGSGGPPAGKKRQRQDEDGDDDDEEADEPQRGKAAAGAQQASELEDESSAEESEVSEDDDDEGDEEEPPLQRRPAGLSSRVKVIQGRRAKPPLAPKQKKAAATPAAAAAAPPRRSFLTLAVATSSKQAKRRSEVDRRLEQLVMKQSWKLKEPSKQSVIKVLRMFNLCDITPRQTDDRQQQQQQARAAPSPQQPRPPEQQQPQPPPAGVAEPGGGLGGATIVGEEGLPALPAHLQPLQALRGAELEARERESEARFKTRQRARMADMGMLLDVVLASSSDKLRKEWVDCGILTQLQVALGRLPFTQEYSVVLVKVVGVLEHLPVSSDDLYALRSAHGTFADLIRRMASSATDWEVRRRSHQLLKRYAAANCSDATLLALQGLPGPNGKPYLLSLHLPPGQLQRLMAAPSSAAQLAARRRQQQPPGPMPPRPGAAPWGGFGGPPGVGAPPGGPPWPLGGGGDPHSSPSASHGPGSMDAPGPDGAGGWPQQQQQQPGLPPWEAGSGGYPPPWAGGGGPPPSHLPPPMPGSRQGAARPPSRPGPWSPSMPGYGGGLLRQGSGMGDMPEGAAGPGGGGGPHSPGARPWGGPPEWGRPSDDWEGRGGGGPYGGPPPPGGFEGGAPLPYSFRERSRARERERPPWERDPHWQQQQRQGGYQEPPPHEASKRQRLSSSWDPGNGPPASSSKPRITDILADDDEQQQQQPGGGGGWGSRQESLPGPPGGSPAGGGGSRGWAPAAAPPPVGPQATAEDLFVLGVYDSEPSLAPGPQQQQLSPIVSPRGGAPQRPQAWPDSWDQPGPEFEAFVADAVKKRLGKYVQPDHPNRITKEEAQALYKKLRRQVVEVEEAACAERRACGDAKPIERPKLEANIKEFVRLSIRRLPGGGRASGGGGGAQQQHGHHHHQQAGGFPFSGCV